MSYQVWVPDQGQDRYNAKVIDRRHSHEAAIAFVRDVYFRSEPFEEMRVRVAMVGQDAAIDVTVEPRQSTTFHVTSVEEVG